VPKDGEPLPPMSRLKALSKQHRETIVMWLNDKTQDEVAKLIERNFDISLGEPEQFRPLLSRWLEWQLRQPELEARNAFAEFLQDRLESAPDLDAELLRKYIMDLLGMMADQTRDAGLLLKLAKELRASDTLELAKDKWRKAKESKLEAGLDALFEEIKGVPRAVEIFDKLKSELSAAE
jgi:hypothetical protein